MPSTIFLLSFSLIRWKPLLLFPSTFNPILSGVIVCFGQFFLKVCVYNLKCLSMVRQMISILDMISVVLAVIQLLSLPCSALFRIWFFFTGTGVRFIKLKKFSARPVFCYLPGKKFDFNSTTSFFPRLSSRRGTHNFLFKPLSDMNRKFPGFVFFCVFRLTEVSPSTSRNC